jgi:hypothetical protein
MNQDDIIVHQRGPAVPRERRARRHRVGPHQHRPRGAAGQPGGLVQRSGGVERQGPCLRPQGLHGVCFAHRIRDAQGLKGQLS